MMNWLKILACIVSIAGIALIVEGSLYVFGILVLIEGGVLFTLVQENRAKG
jgi:hypothetical protein